MYTEINLYDYDLGIGDWANPQSPIPNPQSPIPIFKRYVFIKNKFF